MGRKYSIPLDLGLVIKNKKTMVRINKFCKDEKEAELWEEDCGNTANNELTLVLRHKNIDGIEAIYDRSDLSLLFYNISLDKLDKNTKLDIETPKGTFNIDNKDEILAQLNEFVSLPETNGIIYKTKHESNVFATPTFKFIGDNGQELNVELWLYELGHRYNQIHLYFN